MEEVPQGLTAPGSIQSIRPVEVTQGISDSTISKSTKIPDNTDNTLAAELANEPNSREIFDRTMNLGESRALSAKGEVIVFYNTEGTINKALSAQPKTSN
ncbi:hypothetical protein EBU94_00575 [bacterium]|nr:hypothetical protein [bacterium]